MDIQTKYKVGDKVWYYVEQINAYAWGKVTSIEVKVGDGIEINYTIDNRFFDPSLSVYPMSLIGYNFKDYRANYSYNFNESQVFENSEAIRTYLEQKHFEKMSELKELKKGWFI